MEKRARARAFINEFLDPPIQLYSEGTRYCNEAASSRTYYSTSVTRARGRKKTEGGRERERERERKVRKSIAIREEICWIGRFGGHFCEAYGEMRADVDRIMIIMIQMTFTECALHSHRRDRVHS